MSSLLDEAIVDAKALREAVLKNAEASLLEAYAPKIEEAVEQLLEQDPMGAASMPMDIGAPPVDIGAPPGGLGMAPVEEEPEDTGATFAPGEEEELGDIDYAALSDLDDDSTLEDEVELDITRGELQSMLESITRDIESLEEEMEEADEEDPVEEGQVEIDDDLLEAFEGEDKEETDSEDSDELDKIIERLIVDVMPTKSGWAGTPESVMQHNEELAAAMAESDKYQEEKEELIKVGKDLAESNKKYQKVNTKLKNAVDILKEKLDEVNLTNAKLLYTNRILRKSSLNERQKNKIVEALSSAGSVNEAKVLYETLQSAVGSSKKEAPKSLNEAVSRPSNMLPRRKVQSTNPNPFMDRMKILAGIKDK